VPESDRTGEVNLEDYEELGQERSLLPPVALSAQYVGTLQFSAFSRREPTFRVNLVTTSWLHFVAGSRQNGRPAYACTLWLSNLQ